MKKLGVLTVTLLFSAILFAQGDLDKTFYFRLGYSKPTKKYAGVDNTDYWDGVKRNGIHAEIGQIFILNSIPLADGLRLGINADYASFYFHGFKSDFGKQRFLTFGSKVGPSLSYSPVDKLVFDTYIKINPAWLSAAFSSVEDLTGEDYQFYLGYLGLGYSFGVNVRYSLLIVGFDFNTSWNKLEHYDENTNEFDGTYIGNASDIDKDRTPVPSFNFTIGLAF